MILLYILITLITFSLMEIVTWLTHKYVMHGLMWYFHEDHHQPGYKGIFERNDVFFIVFAVPSILLFYFGVDGGLNYLFFIGFLCVLGGYAWDLTFPFNKNLWSSSFVLFTSGWAFMSFAACILIVDVHGYQKIAKFGVIYGSNAITVYVLAGMLPILLNSVLGVQDLFYNGLVDIGLAPKLASALWAFSYMFICFVPAYIMYRKKIFIKV